MMISPRIFASALLLTLSALISSVEACGGFFCAVNQPVVQAGEAIAFGVQDRTLTMHVQILYEGPAENFSWLLPIPLDDLEIGVGSDRLFSQLFQTTLPSYTLTVDNSMSDSCDAGNFDCIAFDTASVPQASVADVDKGVVMVEEGSVGPFDFATLSSEDPTAVFDWLENNGYDQPDESRDLVNFYAKDHKFVALRLNKEFDTGDIVPLTITGTLPEEATSMACVPLQLTRIAAMEDMPIQIYMMGDGRGVPTNFFEVVLDDALVDWVGCQNNPSCYYQDHIDRFRNASVTPEVNKHAFLTEFVGEASIMEGLVEYGITSDRLEVLKTARAFLDAMSGAGITRSPLVDSIVNKYVPVSTIGIAEDCAGLDTLFQPSQSFLTINCFPEEDIEIDSVAFAAELDEKVLKPAADSQAFVDSFKDKTLTRLYTSQGPDSMIKDPYFSFDPNGIAFSNVHQATGVPICAEDPSLTTGLNITIEDGRSFVTPAELNCFFWSRPADSSAPSVGVNPAISFSAPPFGDDPAIEVFRDADGSFPSGDIIDTRRQLDARAPNQTVVPFVEVTGGDSSGFAPSMMVAAVVVFTVSALL